MDEAEGGGGVELAGGADAGNAIGVEADIDRAGEAGDAGLLRARREGQPERARDQGGNEHHEEAEAAQQTADQPEQGAHGPKVEGRGAVGKGWLTLAGAHPTGMSAQRSFAPQPSCARLPRSDRPHSASVTGSALRG